MQIKVNNLITAEIEDAVLWNVIESNQLLEMLKVTINFEFKHSNNNYSYEVMFCNGSVDLIHNDFITVELMIFDEEEDYQRDLVEIEQEANLIKEEIEFSIRDNIDVIENKFLMNSGITRKNRRAVKFKDRYFQDKYYLMSKSLIDWSIDCVNAGKLIDLSEEHISFEEIQESTGFDKEFIKNNMDLILREWTEQHKESVELLINNFIKITPKN